MINDLDRLAAYNFCFERLQKNNQVLNYARGMCGILREWVVLYTDYRPVYWEDIIHLYFPELDEKRPFKHGKPMSSGDYWFPLTFAGYEQRTALLHSILVELRKKIGL